MKLIIFSGSARQGNYTQFVANFVYQTISQHPEVDAEIVSPQNLQINFTDEGTQAAPSGYQEKIKQADGYIIVSPEYNHGYSASVKYMLDMALPEYNHKPVAFVGVSKSAFGGVRMIENLVNVVRELGLIAASIDVYFSNNREEIKDGQIVDPDKWSSRINKMLTELLWLAKTLKHGREKM